MRRATTAPSESRIDVSILIKSFIRALALYLSQSTEIQFTPKYFRMSGPRRLGSPETEHRYRLPTELFDFLPYTRSLSFTQEPDYDNLRSNLLPAVSSLTVIKKEAHSVLCPYKPNGSKYEPWKSGDM